jgi:hypothetical protein
VPAADCLASVVRADQKEDAVKSISITRAAVAIGAVVVAGAFGAGYAPSEALGESDVATGAARDAAVGHTFGAALTESLALKQHSRSHRLTDIRKRRIE